MGFAISIIQWDDYIDTAVHVYAKMSMNSLCIIDLC